MIVQTYCLQNQPEKHECETNIEKNTDDPQILFPSASVVRNVVVNHRAVLMKPFVLVLVQVAKNHAAHDS